MQKYFALMIAIGLALVSLATPTQSANADTPSQGDILTQGRYIATVAGCTSCHTPDRPEYLNPPTLTLDQIKTLAFDGNDALDISKFLAGSISQSRVPTVNRCVSYRDAKQRIFNASYPCWRIV